MTAALLNTSVVRPTRSVAGIAAQVEAARHQLAMPRQRIEGAFLGIGGHLAESAGVLAGISTLFEALPRDLDSPEMREATHRLEAIGEKAQALADSFATERGDIEILIDRVAGVARPLQDLQKSVRMIGLVAVNARIAAASVSGRDDFSVFTTDIAQLSEGAAKTVQDFSTVYEKLVAVVHAANAQRQTFKIQHGDTPRLISTRLRSHLEEIASQRQKAASSSTEIGELSRQIATEIGSAVSALQIGDITRQRVEHVEEALASLEAFLARAPGESAGEVEVSPLLTVGAVCKLQSAQLGQALEDFDREGLQVVDSLHKLAADAGRVVDHSRRLFGDQATVGRSSLSSLSEQLREGCRVLRDCETNRAEFDRVAAEAVETVNVLLGHVAAVQQIEGNMRLVSLNTAVKCSRLGPAGMTLNVIANELRLLTGHTVDAADAVMAGLKEAASIALRLGDGGDTDFVAQIVALEDEAQVSIGLLEAVDARLSNALASLDRDGAQAIGLLDKAISGMGVHDRIGGALRGAQARIEALAGAARGEAADGENLALVKERVRSVLQAGYTMESERHLHERFLGPAGEPQSPSPGHAAPESALDDILF